MGGNLLKQRFLEHYDCLIN
jgi:hypothetical protein